MKINPNKCYVFDGVSIIKLENICRALYGDGTSLSHDRRRDLANMMRYTLDCVEEFDGGLK